MLSFSSNTELGIVTDVHFFRQFRFKSPSFKHRSHSIYLVLHELSVSKLDGLIWLNVSCEPHTSITNIGQKAWQMVVFFFFYICMHRFPTFTEIKKIQQKEFVANQTKLTEKKKSVPWNNNVIATNLILRLDKSLSYISFT